MFTGIIEETGRILAVKRGARSSVLTIGAEQVLDDLKLGDSVAVNGVCLTVRELGASSFSADVMHESLERSALGLIARRSRVNLERAMPANGRFGGHLVSGHIDGTGTIARISRDDNAVWFTIRAEDRLLRYIVEKGSITIDGISLTVAAVEAGRFSVSVIPHTFRSTTLGEKKVGSLVNLETDIVGKYLERFLNQGPAEPGGSRLTADFLAKAGF